MKAKEYVQKYSLDKSKHFDHQAFVNDFKKDVEKSRNSLAGPTGGTFNSNPLLFEQFVKSQRQKFDSIFNKSLLKTQESEKIWKFIYATIFIPIRNSVFGEEFKNVKHKYKMDHDPEYRRKAENYQAHKQYEEFESEFFRKMHSDILKAFLGINMTPPAELLERFQLKVLYENNLGHLTSEMVQSKYKELVKVAHPDSGGSHDKFVQLQKDRDSLLKYC